MTVGDNEKELFTRMREQYDYLPYPESEIHLFPSSLEQLYIHSLVTPYYLRYQAVINTADKIILDAGCGSGMQALALAAANPGAKIIGVDLSEKSIELARQRFDYHQIPNAEFYAISLEDISSLGYQYDLINCDEVLYLLPDPGETLKLFQSILSPHGIIRANLHSYHQRREYYRVQELLKFIGIADEESVETALFLTKETVEHLKDDTRMRIFYQDYADNKLQVTGSQSKEKMLDEWIFMNYLLRGDQGYTIPELFAFIENADLDFLSMVNWRHWNLLDLFRDQQNLPLFWQLSLESASDMEKLHIYELLNPVHRLLDFWCVQPSEQNYPLSPVTWDAANWEKCVVHLHPVLKQEFIQQQVLRACNNRESLDFSQYIKLNTLNPVIVDCEWLACLISLWDCPQTFPTLLDRWLKIQPLSLTSLAPKSLEQGAQELQELLSKLEFFTFLLLELESH